MNPSDLLELLKARPFRPFEMALSNGERCLIRPENMLIGRTKCYRPAFDGELVDHIVHVALDHVVRAEALNGVGPPPH